MGRDVHCHPGEPPVAQTLVKGKRVLQFLPDSIAAARRDSNSVHQNPAESPSCIHCFCDQGSLDECQFSPAAFNGPVHRSAEQAM